MKLLKILIPVTIAAVVVAVGGFSAYRALTATHQPNIILISLDTTRPDHLSCYGRRTNLTPHIDKVAAGAVLFTNAKSPVPLTLPAHSAMLTGMIPPRHGVHDNLYYQLAEENTTLAERLKQAGYQTAAVVGSFVLDARFGLAQGFDFYDDELTGEMSVPGHYAERRGEEVSQVGIEWLESKRDRRPFFLFLHYYDPHHPYRPPPPFDSIYADRPYEGEVAYTDQCVGTVLDKLRALDLYDDSLIIITADHGEGLGEHGEDRHGYFVYNSTTTVPLIIKLPGRTAAVRVKHKVGLVDLAPTVLSMLRLPTTTELDGEDLTPMLTGQRISASASERMLYSESFLPTRYGCNSLLAVESSTFKYIQTTNPELYDLRADPEELHNLLDTQVERAAAYQRELRELLEAGLRTVAGATAALDEESRKRLGALGYIDTGQRVVASYEFDSSRRDPKGFLDTFTRFEAIDHYLHLHDLETAERLCREVLAEYPEIAFVHAMLGDIAFKQGKRAEALQRFERAVTLDPQWLELRNNYGALLMQGGRIDDAIVQLKAALTLALGASDSSTISDAMIRNRGANGGAFKALLNLANAFSARGDAENAVTAAREAGEFAPRSDTNGLFQLGMTWRNLGDAKEAARCFQLVLETDPSHAAARQQLEGLSSSRATSP